MENPLIETETYVRRDVLAEARSIDTGRPRDGGELWKGAVAGTVAGLAATWAMTQLQSLLSEAMSSGDDERERGDADAADDGGSDDPATVQAAQAASRRLRGRPLDDREKGPAGQLVHFGFGTAMGALYGATAEVLPIVTTGYGTAWGATLFAAADEVAVPAMGFSPPPTESPPSTHLYGLASHLVYGAVTDLVRRGVRRML